MKTIEQYISEHILKGHLTKQQYKYHPETKDELIEAIETELYNGNTNLNCIDTSKINNMWKLFDQDNGIKLSDEQQKTLDVSKWNVSNVTTMYDMFNGCTHFNSDLSNWNVSNVTDMYGMFFMCKQFNSDLPNWNVSNVTDMYCMFSGCKQFNSDLSNWNVSKVEDMFDMFRDSGLKGNKPKWYKK